MRAGPLELHFFHGFSRFCFGFLRFFGFFVSRFLCWFSSGFFLFFSFPSLLLKKKERVPYSTYRRFVRQTFVQ
jgi:hypothetical protein